MARRAPFQSMTTPQGTSSLGNDPDRWQRELADENPVAGRGRRKAVEKFTSRQGLWMLGILVLVCIFVLIDALENVK